MTNLFKKSITSFAIFSLFFGTVSVSAQRPAPTELQKTSVPMTQAPFLYYFPYGSITSDVDLTNQAAKMTITNVTTPGQTPAFEVVPAENFDIFNGDPNRLATDAAPAGPGTTCNTFTGTRYPMPVSFFTTSGMSNYGLQTIKNNPTSGASTGTFRQKSSGCMAFKLKVGANAKVGDQARITFDWDSALSPNIQEAQRPAIQTGLLEVTAGTASSVSSASSAPSSSASSSSSSMMAMMVASSSSSSKSSSPSSSSAPSSSSSSSSDPCKVGSFFGGLNAYADGTSATTTTTPSGGGTAPTTTTTTTPATTTTTTTPATTTTTNTNCITKTVTTGGFGIAVLVGLIAIGGGAAVMIKTRKKEVKVDIGSK